MRMFFCDYHHHHLLYVLSDYGDYDDEKKNANKQVFFSPANYNVDNNRIKKKNFKIARDS